MSGHSERSVAQLNGRSNPVGPIATQRSGQRADALARVAALGVRAAPRDMSVRANPIPRPPRLPARPVAAPPRPRPIDGVAEVHSGAQLEYEAPPFEKHSPTDSDSGSDSDSEEEGPQEQLIHDVWLEFAECPKDPNFIAFGRPLPPGPSAVGRRQSADVTVLNL